MLITGIRSENQLVIGNENIIMHKRYASVIIELKYC